MKLSWPAPERNKDAILAVLQRVLPAQGRVLEVASGSGQHVVHFARHLPQLQFLPSDIEPANLESIRAWVRSAQLPNLQEPLTLDVCASDYGVGSVEALLSANLVHIAPWHCAEGLFEGARRHLAAAGVLVLYGPYHIGGQATAPSNAAFDAELRQRDARWGVRDLEAVAALGARVGLELHERVAMPANNQLLVFRQPGAVVTGISGS
jgi:SAM-dependent methyltransferase